MIEPVAFTQAEANLIPDDASWEPEDFAHHLARYGPVPTASPALIPEIQASGLKGRGGAGFPAGLKWRAVADRAGGRGVVLVNGVEADPTSGKDRLLMTARPHLVLDGALMAARSVGAAEIVVGVNRTAVEAHRAMAAAVSERREPVRIEVVGVPSRYVAGEETALAQFVSGGPARPTLTPPRPFQRGVRGRPTLVHNSETLAWAALIGRRGGAWYRALGSEQHPGAMLVTVAGACARPGVYELPCSASVGEALARAGVTQAQAVLIGGYFGTWVPMEPSPSMGGDATEPLGSNAGVILALPAASCGLAETARIMSFLAGESARQCGPCFNGLPALSSVMARVAVGRAGSAEVDRLRRWAGQLTGHRGACHHPDGAVTLLESALRTFEADLTFHLRRGACQGSRQPSVLPAAATEDGWR
ncbi:MAG: proton-conducting membrane transporter [Chloroflexi bacterium]|nr:MAG: proton-conducting membrane transporter [Chloroflexota bacterium]